MQGKNTCQPINANHAIGTVGKFLKKSNGRATYCKKHAKDAMQPEVMTVNPLHILADT